MFRKNNSRAAKPRRIRSFNAKKEVPRICELKIEGMDCASCALKVENKLLKTQGIKDVKIAVSAEKASISYDQNKTDVSKIKEAIEKAGYEAEEYQWEKEVHHGAEILRISLVAVAIILSWSKIWRPSLELDIFSIIAVILGGIPIFKKAYYALRARTVTMEVAMTIGIVASLTIREFLAAAVIVLFTLFAEYLDELTTDRGRKAIRELLKIFPQEATIKRANEEKIVKVDKIHHDDIVTVKPGERIPVDGNVIGGQASVNQAPITGEPMPVSKGKGDTVLAGSISEGLLQIRVTNVGKDTTLGKIIKLVEEAEGTKSKVQKFADRFSARFVPAVLGLGLLVFLVTGNPLSAIATIVVACPCAIALATPLAVVASAGKAARKGIIIKGGVFLEELSKIDTVVLDKTGTLTLGEPKITDIKALRGHTEEEIVTLAAIAEKYSEHPLAKAVLGKAKEYGLKVPDPREFKAIRGQGVIAYPKNDQAAQTTEKAATILTKEENEHYHHVILLGNKILFEKRDVAIPPEIEDYSRAKEKNGETVVLIGHDREVCGAISIADVVREETKQALRDLKKIGLTNLIMLTGDSWRPAKAVASQVGIDEVVAEMMPHDKVEKVKKLVEENRRVLMIGDGVNDAPALAHANVGMAMGVAGSDVAIEAADIALMTNDLRAVGTTINIGRKTFSVIRQNIYGSIIFNVLGITLAAAGILTPLMAAVAHAIPDFLLFLNSSRLIRK